MTGSDGRIRYQAPDAAEVPGLMAEVVEWLQNGDRGVHTVIRAAMAHLHVVSVHPFRDGNGRISRIVQSLVLAQEGLMSPEFGSIEEYLGGHTADYYAALDEAHGARYRPERDVSEWVAFCVKAHLAQARQRLRQIEEAAARWTHLERLVDSRGWPDRLIIALEQSLIGGTDRMSYAAEAAISAATASADFRRLLDSGLVDQLGRGRSVRTEPASACTPRSPRRPSSTGARISARFHSILRATGASPLLTVGRMVHRSELTERFEWLALALLRGGARRGADLDRPLGARPDRRNQSSYGAAWVMASYMVEVFGLEDLVEKARADLGPFAPRDEDAEVGDPSCGDATI